jgi:hypothetical protein
MGTRLISTLLARGHRVRALARQTSLGRVPEGATPVVGDALDAEWPPRYDRPNVRGTGHCGRKFAAERTDSNRGCGRDSTRGPVMVWNPNSAATGLRLRSRSDETNDDWGALGDDILPFGPCHRWLDRRQPGGGCLAAFDCVGSRHLGIRGKLERVAAGHAELEGSQ